MQIGKGNFCLDAWLFCRLTLLSAIFLLSACGDDKKDEKTSTDASASFDSLWSVVFENRCGTCHGVQTNSDTLGGPDMASKDAMHTNLVSKSGADYPDWDTFQINRADCQGYSFIKPGNASESLIVAIFDSSVTPCTVKSHTQAPQNIAISATSLESLKSWINGGAVR